MKHYFLDSQNIVNRLVQEYYKYGRLVVAFDFDNTIFDYHNQGHDYGEVIELLRECRKLGCYLIVFTCNTEEKYSQLIDFMNANDIPFDAINENADFLNGQFKGRKIYYNILLDDRAGLESAYFNLSQAIHTIQTTY